MLRQCAERIRQEPQAAELETVLALFASWVSRWIWIGATLSIPLILLYYPDGNLPSVRWRPVVPLIWGVVIITFFFSAVDPTPMEEFTRSMPNPFAVETPAWLTPIVGVVFWGLALLPVLGAISLIPRYRRSEGVERQQMKLIAWVGAVAVVYLLILRAVLETSPVADAISNTVFVAAANRTGREDHLDFWGGSFVSDPFGKLLGQASPDQEETLLVSCDLNQIQNVRKDWPFLSCRRAESYE